MNTRSLLRCVFASIVIAFAFATPLAAQAGERDFFESAADDLDAYAKSCFDSGFPNRARQVWLEVIHEYVTDHEKARQALGFLRVGSSWAEDPKFEYPREETPDADAARRLQKRWQKICKELGTGHRKLGVAMAAAGVEERSKYHFDRALRFLPDDDVAVKAAGLGNYEGLSGTPAELTILERSRRMQHRIEALLKRDWPVETLPESERHELLDKGGVDYSGVRSEHFTIWGNWPVESLTLAANDAERSLAFCVEMFGPSFEWPHEGGHRALAFFQKDDEWKAILQANAGLFRDGELDFIFANARITALGKGELRVRIASMTSEAEIRDFAVRDTAQALADFKSDALNEGIGHTVVGLFFGRNLIFTVAKEEETGRTSSGAKKEDVRLELPDLEVWKDLAAEAAWERGDLPAAKLPLLTAANFPSTARIKAWSFCDYLLRREPKWLTALDLTKEAGATTEPKVIEEFSGAVDGAPPLPRLDDAWRAFWTRDTPVMRAIRGDKTPLESVSKAAPAFLSELNRVRASWSKPFKTESFGWNADYSERCKDHALYLKANRSERGPDEEHTQVANKKAFSAEGRDFAQRALVASNAKDFADEVDRWLDWPGYRDALLNRAIAEVGLFVEGKIAVVDVTRGIRSGAPSVRFPFRDQKNFGIEVAVAELGADVATLLQKSGRRKAKLVGYPLSYHFYKASSMPARDSIEVTLTRGGDELPGVLHYADTGSSRRSAAPGMIVYYPLDPLPRGSALSVRWQFTEPGGKQFDETVNFKTR